MLEAIAGVLGWTPLGAAFAVPGDAAAGAWGPADPEAPHRRGDASGSSGSAWQALVARMLVTPGREASRKSYRGLGWFDRHARTAATGAVAARSLTYWFRDARYWVSLVMVPIVPVLVIVPLAIAGVPDFYVGLIPVPLMCLLPRLEPAQRHRVRLDRDLAARRRRACAASPTGSAGSCPVLIAGILVIGLGSAVTVFVLNDWRLLPSLLGVSTALLLGGLGVGSITSARFPYPAVKPGDSPVPAAAVVGHDHRARAVDHDVRLAARRAARRRVRARSGSSSTRRGTRRPSPQASDSACSCSPSGSGCGGRVFDRRGPEMLSAALRA